MKQADLFRVMVIAVLAGLIAAPSFAHKGATGIVKERMEAMSAMKDAMAAIGNMLAGKTAYDETIAANAAGELLRHGMRIVDQFPDNEESRQKVSEATELVWSDKARFDSLANDLNTAAEELRIAIRDGDRNVIKARFAATGKTCSACHEDFRLKKHH